MVGDSALCNGASDILETELKGENVKGLALTQLPCAYHGANNAKNTTWLTNIKCTGNQEFWKGNNRTYPALPVELCKFRK